MVYKLGDELVSKREDTELKKYIRRVVVHSHCRFRYEPLTTDDTPQPPLNLSEILPPQPLTEGSTGPIRRGRTNRKQSAESAIREKYRAVLEMVKSGTSARQAIQHIEMARSTFYKWHVVAELKIVDSALYSYLKGIEALRTVQKFFDGLRLTKETFAFGDEEKL
ncbi:hypothetical protein ACHWQZ_G003526 [Mnemiopsis leidyi]